MSWSKKNKAAGSEPINKKTVRIPREENPLMYKICGHTQQMLDMHVHPDQKEKEHLAAEVNHI